MEIISFLQNMTVTFWGNYGFHTLFYFSLVLILIFEKRKICRAGVLGYSVCILMIIYNPAMYYIYKYFFSYGSLTAYYCRLFYLIPIVFVIAYAAVLILQRVSGWKRLCCTFLILLVITSSGHIAYSEEYCIRSSNFNKVPVDVVQLCEMFHNNKEPVHIMVPTDLTPYMRQMDSNFSMPYGRYQDTDISNQLQSETPDAAFILKYASDNQTDYIVALYTEATLAQYTACGCEVIGFTDRYIVLKYISKE